jgi:hypothetical protein
MEIWKMRNNFMELKDNSKKIEIFVREEKKFIQFQIIVSEVQKYSLTSKKYLKNKIFICYKINKYDYRMNLKKKNKQQKNKKDKERK